MLSILLNWLLPTSIGLAVAWLRWSMQRTQMMTSDRRRILLKISKRPAARFARFLALAAGVHPQACPMLVLPPKDFRSPILYMRSLMPAQIGHFEFRFGEGMGHVRC